MNTIAIIGAGIMGAGIAQVCAQNGFNVNLVDISDNNLSKGAENIRDGLNRLANSGQISMESVDEALGRIHCGADLPAAVENVGLVIESIPEDVDSKLQLFAELDEKTSIETILASNTSSISIAELAAATKRPGKVVGTHFFNPVPLSEGVELIMGQKTSERTMTIVRDFVDRIQKQAIIVKDSPGFLINRLLPLLVNESFHLLQEGVASAEEIDRACAVILKHPIGPLRMADLAGLDTVLYVLEYLQGKLGEKYRPSPLLRQMVNEGRFGRKTGAGVYKYQAT